MGGAFRFAVVGAGDIAGFYLGHFNARPPEQREGIEFAGVWNRTLEKGRAFTAKHGGRTYVSLEELLADPAVDAVVNLTSPAAHADITRQALSSGKHVLTEKPLAVDLKEAGALVSLARKKGLTLAVAPFVLLGRNQRRVKELLDSGHIGRPVSATAELFHGRVETWHPNPEQFYVEGAGPVLDVGPYPVSLLLHWFGRVAEVQAMFDIALPQRTDLSGRSFQVRVYDQGVALLRFECGLIARIAFSMANSNTNCHGLEIQGTNGSLSLESIMAATGELRLSEKDSSGWDHVEGAPGPWPASGVDWSAGIFELAAAVRERRLSCQLGGTGPGFSRGIIRDQPGRIERSNHKIAHKIPVGGDCLKS